MQTNILLDVCQVDLDVVLSCFEPEGFESTNLIAAEMQLLSCPEIRSLLSGQSGHWDQFQICCEPDQVGLRLARVDDHIVALFWDENVEGASSNLLTTEQLSADGWEENDYNDLLDATGYGRGSWKQPSTQEIMSYAAGELGCSAEEARVEIRLTVDGPKAFLGVTATAEAFVTSSTVEPPACITSSEGFDKFYLA